MRIDARCEWGDGAVRGAGRRQPLWLVVLLLAVLATRPARAQEVRVTGRVSALATREAIPGATVQVLRTKRGVASNADGEFSIEAGRSDTLLFRALGFKSLRLPLGGSGLSQLIVQIKLVRDSVQLGEVRVTSDRADRAVINRALRNVKRPAPPVVSGVKRPPKPKPLFAVDTTAPKAPVPTIQSPVSLIYDQFSREGKQRRKMEEIQAAEKAEQLRKAREKYNKQFRDNRGYE